MIPDFEGGHLPPGRHPCTLDDIERSLVNGQVFEASTMRRDLFKGFVRYLAEWEGVQEVLGAPRAFLHAVWIGGSFASQEVNPNDIDVSPLIDAPLASSFHGRPGVKRIEKLIRHRPSIRDKYGVDVFPIAWHPVVHVLNESTWDNVHREYLTDRGKFDDFWQRCRVNGSDTPSEESCVSRRGYLEVRL